MTPRKSKISYRDLLASREREDAQAPERDEVTPVPDAPAASAPAPVVARSATPISLAAVLNAPRRLTPIASPVIATPGPAPAGSVAPTATPTPLRATPAPRVAPRTTRRFTRATIAGRIVVESAIRADLSTTGRSELLRFRIGPERFALRLADVDEAVEAPVLHPLPDLPRHVLGVLAMRGRLVPVHAPTHVLGVGIGSLGVALVLHGDPPLALAVDDVEDVLMIQPRTLHDAPGVDDPDGVLVGVTRHDGRLVGVLDARALAVACLVPAVQESR